MSPLGVRRVTWRDPGALPAPILAALDALAPDGSPGSEAAAPDLMPSRSRGGTC